MQFLKHLTDPALKRLYKFVLKRMVGRFLANDTLDLDQLDVHLRAGRLELCDLKLNADVLNAELCVAHNLPFRVKTGYLGSVRVTISYANIMSESCLVEIDDVEIVLVPLDKADDDLDDVNRSFRTDAASAAAAAAATATRQQQPVRSTTATSTTIEPVDLVSQEGLDFVASWIEQVTSKIKVTLSNVCLRLETGEQHNGRNVALLCRLAWLQFTDESASDVESVYAARTGATAHDNLTAAGATQSMAASALFGISQKGVKFRGASMELLLSPDADAVSAGFATASDLIRHPFLAMDATRQCFIHVKLSHFDALEAPAVDADVFIHAVRVVLQPQHFPELSTLIDAFAGVDVSTISTATAPFATATSMYESICAQQPAWLDDHSDGNNTNSSNAQGDVNLSLQEFARIEQLLVAYRATHDALRRVPRRTDSPRDENSSPNPFTVGQRKLSAADSVESCGLSDLEDDDDDERFYDADPGAMSSMAQSMYASALYESAMEQQQLPRTASFTATTRSSRHVQTRVKLHLLECTAALLYDDLPDDDDDDAVDDDDEEAKPDSPVDRSSFATPKASALPSVDGCERLELTCSDTICSVLVFATHVAVAVHVGSIDLCEKLLPRLSTMMDDVDESAMLTTHVAQFAAMSPATGRAVHQATSISAHLRLDFGLETSNNSSSNSNNGLSLTIHTQPLVVEWDMHILDRAHRYMAMLEASNKAQAAAAAKQSTTARTPAAVSYTKRLELTTECIEVALRFPMVNSDVIRFGPSATRGLCEDKLVLTLESVVVASSVGSSSSSSSAKDKDGAVNDTNGDDPLPWLSAFDVRFERVKAVLATPAAGNQRAMQLDKVVMLTATSDAVSQRKCGLTLRLQTPTAAHVYAAVVSKQNLSQDSDEHPDAATARSSDDRSRRNDDRVSGDDNDGGRIGLNGWSLDAVQRAQHFEAAAAAASLFDVTIALPHAQIDVSKATLDRLMVLMDALLMINPIDVSAFNDALATTSRVQRQPSYMSVRVVVQEGALTLSDTVPSAAKTTAVDASATSCVAYHFAFEQLSIFQVSQWLGQLVSRAHVAAQTLTLLEELHAPQHCVVPIVYSTPYGRCDAPLLFVSVDIADQTNAMRELKVALHVSHTSLRYDTASLWLKQLLDMLLLEYPAPIIPLDSASMTDAEAAALLTALETGSSAPVTLAVAPKTVFTKLNVHFYDILIDYAPPTLASRLLLQLGRVRVSSNVVTGAVLQGYKVIANDLQLFLTHARASYDDIDASLLGRERLVQRADATNNNTTTRWSDGSALRTATSTYPSLLMFLEQNGFLKMVTMDIIDVFVRALVPVANSTNDVNNAMSLEDKAPVATATPFPELSVELSLGTANIYTCYDSFSTLIELLSNWSDALAVDAAPRDTMAYVGLDRVLDSNNSTTTTTTTTSSSSVSVVTNRHATSRASGRTLSVSPPFAPASSSNATSIAAAGNVSDSRQQQQLQQLHRRRSASSSSESINVLAQIDEHAFSSSQPLFAGAHVATDTEARLLRTRLDAIQKQKRRIVSTSTNSSTSSRSGDAYDAFDSYSTSAHGNNLTIAGAAAAAAPRMRISELVIEDYYTNTTDAANEMDESSAGAFLLDSKHGATANDSTIDPWFVDRDTPALNAPTMSPELHPVGSLPDKSAVLLSEHAARWLPPSVHRDDDTDALLSPSGGFLVASTPSLSLGFDALDDHDAEEMFAMHDIGDAAHAALQTVDRPSDSGDDNAFEYDLDGRNTFPAGAFATAAGASSSKHWWNHQQQQHDDVELSELQTDDGTDSTFSRRLDAWNDDDDTSSSNAHAAFPLLRIAEDHVDQDRNAAADDDDDVHHPMSMSFIGAGANANTEVELAFQMDSDLQTTFNRLLDLDDDDDDDAADDGDDDRSNDASDEEDDDGARSRLEDDLSGRRHRASYQEMSSPRPILQRQPSFASSTASSTRAMSTTSRTTQPAMSPPDEPIARWFYDDDDDDDDDGDRNDQSHRRRSGPPSRIYPHHVEIPIGGAAASLSFGAKESDDAVRNIAKETAAMRSDVAATPPVVVTHVLLRDFSICMRLFGGADWTSEAAVSAANRHAAVATPAPTEMPVSTTPSSLSSVPSSASLRAEVPTRNDKLLSALLDNYVPSTPVTAATRASLFGGDDPSATSSLFGGATNTPTRSTTAATSASATASERSTPPQQQQRKRLLKSGGGRKTEEMLELVVSRIQMRVDLFNDVGVDGVQPLASSAVVALGDVEILDYISTSQIRKVICYWKSDVTHMRESSSSMVHVHLVTVRPGPQLCDEHRLRVALLPLRINLDQDVVAFLRQFVSLENATSAAAKTAAAGAVIDPPDAQTAAAAAAKTTQRPRHAPFNDADEEDDEEADDDDGVERTIDSHDGTEMTHFGAPPTVQSRSAADASDIVDAQQQQQHLTNWFFQSVDVRPCKIKIDYRPNRVDYAALRAGDYVEVLNLFVLEGMELVLRRVKMSGVAQWDALLEQLVLSYVQDIARHQLHKCVASVSMPPLRPFANIGAGAADLILLPIEHYGRDRRVVRGVKKGAKSFLKSVAIETLTTASKVAQGTQALLEHADDVVSSVPSALRRKQQLYRHAGSRIRRNSRRLGGGGIRSATDSSSGGLNITSRQYLTQQPSNASEGLAQAYDALARELHVAAKTIVAVPLVEYQRTGSQGYVRSVIRAVPVAVLRPMIGATEAMSKALIGVRNAVDPELKEDIANKFKDFRGAY